MQRSCLFAAKPRSPYVLFGPGAANGSQERNDRTEPTVVEPWRSPMFACSCLGREHTRTQKGTEYRQWQQVLQRSGFPANAVKNDRLWSYQSPLWLNRPGEILKLPECSRYSAEEGPMVSREEFPASDPSSVGLDARRLSALPNWLDALPGSNIHAVVVFRGTHLVFEHYRPGADQRWGDPLPGASHGRTSLHDLRSVTKGVIGLLIGIALDRGIFPDLDTPVFDALPGYDDLRTPSKDGIRLRHLVTMSSGLAWDENLPATDPRHGEMRLWRAPDALRVALDPPRAEEPGTIWNYNGGSTELLGAVLERASGLPIDEFADEMLFRPLGIGTFEWARHPNGRPSASGGLRLSAIDLAKLGVVLVSGGRCACGRIFSLEWAEASCSPQFGAPDRLFFYGYHW